MKESLIRLDRPHTLPGWTPLLAGRDSGITGPVQREVTILYSTVQVQLIIPEYGYVEREEFRLTIGGGRKSSGFSDMAERGRD